MEPIPKQIRLWAPVALLLASPGAVQSQDYGYATNDGAVTITAYTGPGGGVVIPGTIGRVPVTAIGESAFHRCTCLTSVTIPDRVTDIGDAAFAGCTNLTRVSIGRGVTRIGEGAFEACALTRLTIPNRVTRVEDYAFLFCTRLASVTVGDGVTNLGNYAFFFCTRLRNVTLGKSVARIGDWVFGECVDLQAITVDAENPAYCSVNGVLFDKRQTRLIECPGATVGAYTLPPSVASIGNGAFYACARLTGIYVPGGAPLLEGSSVFSGGSQTTIYFMPGTTGWGATFGGRPTAPWKPLAGTHAAAGAQAD